MAGCLALSVSGAEAPASFRVGELTFSRPPNWEWVETTTPMRRAQLKVVGRSTNEVAGVAFYYFGPQEGGTTEANVQRWLRQFVEPPDKIDARVESVTVGAVRVTYLQAAGTYLSGMPGGPLTPLKGQMLVGAIIEGHEGNVFVRMTGPRGFLKGRVPEFRKLIESALKK